jgi:adenosylhomocysteine nucleosidase
MGGRSMAVVRIFLSLLMLAFALPAAAQKLDETPRTAVISAFPPEIEALLRHTQVERTASINGVSFTLGEIAGQKVLLFASGISMVNAAMNTQLALDRFTVREIVFSGIAGGVDPGLGVGDVVVAEQWGQYLEAVFARETAGSYALPGFARRDFDNFGMIHPQPVEMQRDGEPEPRETFWFPVDPVLLARARTLQGRLALEHCASAERCLHRQPVLVIGGNGVSGSAFVDNAAFRAYVHATFGARLLDMETAAVAAVAHANRVPYIAFRSLADLAGGEAGANEMETFMRLASRNAALALEAFLATGR